MNKDIKIKTFSIFGYCDTTQTKQIRKILIKYIKSKTKNTHPNILLAHYGYFHALALNICEELEKKQFIDYVLVCSSYEVFKSLNLDMNFFFNNVNIMTFCYENIKKEKPVFFSIKKMIDISDEIIFYYNKNNSDKETKFAYEYALSKNKSISNIYK